MQRILRRQVERVMRLAGDDRLGERVAHASAASITGGILLDIDHAVEGIIDRVIAGAAAEIAFQHARQIIACRLIEGRRGHDHACGAEAALEGLRIEKRLLHRVQLAVLGEPLDSGDLALGGAEGRQQAAMIGHAVEPHRAGAAIALVAAFLDTEPAMLAQEGAQALPRSRFRRELPAVDGEVHRASSARICSA